MEKLRNPRRIAKMSNRLVVWIMMVMAAWITSPLLRAQTAAPKAAADEAKPEKWNNIPPPRSGYKNKKPGGTAPRRDISGIWDSAQSLGTSGAPEHVALLPGGRGQEGGHPDETGIAKPLPYTPAGLAALKANHPSGPGVRQVDAALSNDPADKCDPLGFPYMFLWEFRTINVVQTPRQVVMLSPFYGNYRVIWTDGRELPKDPDLRYNGYSVGKWVDDYTFVVETTGLNPRSWIDHAGRPHSDQLQVEETYHRVSLDTIEYTMKITDPKMYTEPWLADDKLPLHLMPPDFDIPELLCSPSEFGDYNNQVGGVVIRDPSQK
jgi:hypothetical protein